METNHEDYELRLRDKAWLRMNERGKQLFWAGMPWSWEEVPRGLRVKMYRMHLKAVREDLLPASNELQPLVLTF